MKISIKKALFGSALAAILTGCGGSTVNPVNGFPDSTPKLPALVGPSAIGGAQLRTLVAGDSWQYAIVGRVTKDVFNGDSKTTVSDTVTGTLQRVVTGATLNGNPVLKLTETMTLTPVGGIPTVELREYYVRQEANRSLTLLGILELDVLTMANSGLGFVPGAWGPTSSVASNGTFQQLAGQPDTTKDLSTTLAVTGATSPMSTDRTAYAAWKTTYSEQNHSEYEPISRIVSNDTISEGFIVRVDENRTNDEEWVPSIGSFVTRELRIARENRVVITWNYDPANNLYTFVLRTEKQTYDLDMVLTSRNLN